MQVPDLDKLLALLAESKREHDRGRYAAGRGVPQDDAEAVAWFRLAMALRRATTKRRKTSGCGTPEPGPVDQAPRG